MLRKILILWLLLIPFITFGKVDYNMSLEWLHCEKTNLANFFVYFEILNRPTKFDQDAYRKQLEEEIDKQYKKYDKMKTLFEMRDFFIKKQDIKFEKSIIFFAENLKQLRSNPNIWLLDELFNKQSNFFDVYLNYVKDNIINERKRAVPAPSIYKSGLIDLMIYSCSLGRDDEKGIEKYEWKDMGKLFEEISFNKTFISNEMTDQRQTMRNALENYMSFLENYLLHKKLEMTTDYMSSLRDRLKDFWLLIEFIPAKIDNYWSLWGK